MNTADLQRYFDKSGDAQLLPGETIENEHGFIVYEIRGDSFFLLHVYGDGRYWQALAERIARAAGCRRIVIGTSRNPQTLERKYGYQTVRTGYILTKEL